MKKLVLLLSVVFVTTTSFTVATETDCDQLALDWYNQTLEGGYGQQTATEVHSQVLGQCWLDGGTTETEVPINKQ